MNRKSKLCLAAALSIALLCAAERAVAEEIETLPADTALEQIQQMQGVVLVDLYADW